jgi:hypothetical protein
VFDDAIADGILDAGEEQQISQLAVALGVELTFDSADRRRIALCRLAHQLDSETFETTEVVSVPFKLAAKEKVIAHGKVAWHEIAALKRPQGIPLGGDNYLRQIGIGEAFLTTKQVTMIGALQSQKFALSSVQRVTRYQDGVLFNRSAGKSVPSNRGHRRKCPMQSQAAAKCFCTSDSYRAGRLLAPSPLC